MSPVLSRAFFFYRFSKSNELLAQFHLKDLPFVTFAALPLLVKKSPNSVGIQGADIHHVVDDYFSCTLQQHSDETIIKHNI